MITKEEFLKLSITNFTRFGSRNFTMDQLAAELGISKRTIYEHFANKQELVSASLQYLLNNIKRELSCIEQKQNEKPLCCIVHFYRVGLEKLQFFNPSFLHGLRKYYPEAYKKYEDFKCDIVYGKVYSFLEKAQEMNQLRKDIHPGLVCKLYLLRMDEIVFSGKLFEEHNREVLLEHLITNNLRGLMTPEYIQEHDFHCKIGHRK